MSIAIDATPTSSSLTSRRRWRSRVRVGVRHQPPVLLHRIRDRVPLRRRRGRARRLRAVHLAQREARVAAKLIELRETDDEGAIARGIREVFEGPPSVWQEHRPSRAAFLRPSDARQRACAAAMPLLGPDEGEDDFWWINWTLIEEAWPASA